MEITHVLNGTLTLDPGSSVARVMDLPIGFPLDRLNQRFSRVSPLDAANNVLFRFESFGAAGPSSRDNFVGVRQFTLVYTLTGVDPIDVEFDIAFVMAADPIQISYGGV